VINSPEIEDEEVFKVLLNGIKIKKSIKTICILPKSISFLDIIDSLIIIKSLRINKLPHILREIIQKYEKDQNLLTATATIPLKLNVSSGFS